MRDSRSWMGVVAALLIAVPVQAQCSSTWSSTFGVPGTIGPVATLAVHDDGSGLALFAGGAFIGVGPVPANNIAKWNGSVWTSVGAGMDQDVTCLTTFDDGFGAALYAGGYFYVAGTSPAERIAKWNGTAWSGLGGNTGGFILALAAYDDGTGSKLY